MHIILWINQNNYMNRQCLKHSPYTAKNYQSGVNYTKYQYPTFKNANFYTHKHPRRISINHHNILIASNTQNFLLLQDFDSQNIDLKLKQPNQPSITIQNDFLDSTVKQINQGFHPNLRKNKTSITKRSKSSNFRTAQTKQDEKSDKFSPSFCNTIKLVSRKSQRIHKNSQKYQTLNPILQNKSHRQKCMMSRFRDLNKTSNRRESFRINGTPSSNKKRFVQRQCAFVDNTIEPWRILETEV